MGVGEGELGSGIVREKRDETSRAEISGSDPVSEIRYNPFNSWMEEMKCLV